MSTSTVEPPFDQLLATADAVARERPDVDLDLAREVFLEAATLLHNGLLWTVWTITTRPPWSPSVRRPRGR
jgi:hypothetical protein